MIFFTAFYIFNKEDTKDTNYFIIYFTNCWCGELLLISEKNDVSGGLK